MASRRPDIRTSISERFRQSMEDAQKSTYNFLEVAEREAERLQQARPSPTPTSDFTGDFEPYFVQKADYYYQGPDLSTRVAAHQFIPNEYEPAEFEFTLSSGQFAPYLIMGKIYVRWVKPRAGSNGLWVYGTDHPIGLDVYRTFKASGSKGKYVRLLEQYGHSEAFSEPESLGI